MIESSPLTVNFAYTDITEEQVEMLVNKMKELDYNRERSYGFVIEETLPDEVSAYLVVTTPIKIQDYDEKQDEVVTKQVDKTELIPFRIDAQKNLLEVFSNQSDTTDVKTRLGEALEWDITISESPVNLAELYEELDGNLYDTEVTSLQISNFSVSDNTTGSYRAKVLDESEGKRLISNHQNDISYLAIEFETTTETATVGFYRSGSVRIYNNIEEEAKLLDYIKESLGRGVMSDA